METNKVSKFLKNNLLTISALAVSLFTLIMYVKQTTLLTRQTDILIEQNKAATWPYLYIGRGVSFTTGVGYPEKFNILITNQGNGPAIIEKAVLRLDGVEIESWSDLYRQMQLPDSTVKAHINSPLRNKVIMPGETYVLIDWPNNADMLKYMYPKFYNLELEICYRSVLNEYWTIKRSSFDEKRYYEDDIITHQNGCQLKASKFFKE